MPTRAYFVAALLLSGAAVHAQEAKPPAAAGQDPAATSKSAAPQDPAKPASQDPAKAPPVPKEKLEQLVAPIALYNDGLLAQVLMASTYPLEIVEAARWQQKNPSLKGDALEKALKDKDWDPSVKSIVGLPTVLKRMNENLEWTQDLGDAFLADQSALMDVVQEMRRKALESGNLKTTAEQKVEEREDKVIVIQSTSPEIVYVPTYYPSAVYVGWGYPSYYYPAMYPPYPPGYAAFSFAVGVAWGAAIWGNCNWGGSNNNNVNIDIDRQNNFSGRTENNFNRPSNRPAGGNSKFQHDPSHRKGVGYRDGATAKQYGGAGTSNRVSRDQARGYGSGSGAGARPSTRPAAGTSGNRPTTGNVGATPRASTSPRPSTGAGTASRPSQATGQRSGSFSGASSANTARASSSRGATSRSSSSGGTRSSGGSRGGGGGRGGGRR